MEFKPGDIVAPWGCVDFVITKIDGNKVYLESDSGNTTIVDITELDGIEEVDRIPDYKPEGSDDAR